MPKYWYWAIKYRRSLRTMPKTIIRDSFKADCALMPFCAAHLQHGISQQNQRVNTASSWRILIGTIERDTLRFRLIKKFNWTRDFWFWLSKTALSANFNVQRINEILIDILLASLSEPLKAWALSKTRCLGLITFFVADTQKSHYHKFDKKGCCYKINALFIPFSSTPWLRLILVSETKTKRTARGAC